MIGSVLSILAGLIKLIGVVSNYLHDKRLIEDGQTREIAHSLQAQADGLAKALAAREAIRADLARDPAGVLRDDEFTRPE